MTSSSRDRISVDVHGLKAALVERADAVGVLPSTLVREALAELLGKTDLSEARRSRVKAVPAGARVRLSLRLSCEQRSTVFEGARRSGMNLGDYVVGLAAEIPALTASGGRTEVVSALVASCAELSTFSRNIRHLTSRLREGAFRPAHEYRVMLDTLADDVHGHLRLASRLLADLRPRRVTATSRQASNPESDRSFDGTHPDVDGVLIQWGDRLLYPHNRIVRSRPLPDLSHGAAKARAAFIRARIQAVVRCAPQVMVKVTGGGRGMKAIAAHFRYISKNGRLDIEDDQGATMRGKEGLRELTDDWRFGGSLIGDIGDRREAFNIMLSMPRGTDPLVVQRAAREFAQVELVDHKYVMVLHDHQANPHVHLSVRAESVHGKRLNPRKADLHRWRETFAEKLRGWGVDAEATRQATLGRIRNFDPLWRMKARDDGRLRADLPEFKSGSRAQATRAEAVEAWKHMGRALAISSDRADLDLARSIADFLREMRPKLDVAESSRTAHIPSVAKPRGVDRVG